MKKLTMILVIIGLFSLNSDALASSPEKSANDLAKELTESIKSLLEFKPNIFRNIEWGIPIESCEGMVLIESEDKTNLYIKKGEKLKIKNAKLERKNYIFYNNQLMAIMVESKGRENLTA